MIALAFLKEYWLPLLIGALALGLLGYIKVLHLEIDHYKAEAIKYETVIKEANAKEEELQQAAQEQTAKYKNALANQFALQEAAGQVVAERIKKDDETKRIALSTNAVELFNASKGPNAEAVAPTISGNVTTGTAVTATLNDQDRITEINDTNHLKCIAKVEKWQQFWKDYTMSYEAIVNNETP